MTMFILLLCIFTLANQQEIKNSLANQQEIKNNCANGFHKDFFSLEKELLTSVRNPIKNLVERKMKEDPLDVLSDIRNIKEQLQNLKQDMDILKQKTDLLNQTKRSCQNGKVTMNPIYPNRLRPVEKMRITFTQAFPSTPIVTHAISVLDIDKNHNLRIDTYISALDRNGFDLNIKHWADTKIYVAGVSWLACPSS